MPSDFSIPAQLMQPDLLEQARHDYRCAKSGDTPVISMQHFLDKYYERLIDNYQYRKDVYAKTWSANDLALFEDAKWWKW
jgi:hypothetical protein